MDSYQLMWSPTCSVNTADIGLPLPLGGDIDYYRITDIPFWFGEHQSENLRHKLLDLSKYRK